MLSSLGSIKSYRPADSPLQWGDRHRVGSTGECVTDSSHHIRSKWWWAPSLSAWQLRAVWWGQTQPWTPAPSLMSFWPWQTWFSHTHPLRMLNKSVLPLGRREAGWGRMVWGRGARPKQVSSREPVCDPHSQSQGKESFLSQGKNRNVDMQKYSHIFPQFLKL